MHPWVGKWMDGPYVIIAYFDIWRISSSYLLFSNAFSDSRTSSLEHQNAYRTLLFWSLQYNYLWWLQKAFCALKHFLSFVVSLSPGHCKNYLIVVFFKCSFSGAKTQKAGSRAGSQDIRSGEGKTFLSWILGECFSYLLSLVDVWNCWRDRRISRSGPAPLTELFTVTNCSGSVNISYSRNLTPSPPHIFVGPKIEDVVSQNAIW